jgi:hypothetical protein
MAVLESIKIKYRTIPIIFSTVLFSVCALWLILGPSTNGIVGKILGNGERISIIGASAIAFSIGVALLFLLHLVRAIIGLPAIESDGRSLRIYVFPFSKLEISEISKIDAGEKWLVITKKSGKTRKVNLAILDDWESKLDSIKSFVR